MSFRLRVEESGRRPRRGRRLVWYNGVMTPLEPLSDFLSPGKNGPETSVAIMEVVSSFSGAKRTMEREKVEEIFRRLNAAGVRYALIGGLACAQYAPPRATHDIDLVVASEDVARVRDLFPGCYRRGTSIASVFEYEGTRFDVQPARRRTQLAAIAKAHPGRFAGEAIQVARVQDLILLKLWASTERQEVLKKDRDRLDVADLLAYNAESISKEDLSAIASDLMGMAFSPQEVASFREALAWLNETLDRLGLEDRKIVLE